MTAPHDAWESSRAAHDRAQPGTHALRLECLRALAARPLTDSELCATVGLPDSSSTHRARRSELVRLRLVDRRGHDGVETVWAATDLGCTVLAHSPDPELAIAARWSEYKRRLAALPSCRAVLAEIVSADDAGLLGIERMGAALAAARELLEM